MVSSSSGSSIDIRKEANKVYHVCILLVLTQIGRLGCFLFSLLSFGYIIILSHHLEIWCGSIGFIETGIFCAVVVLMPLCLACVSFELNWIRTFFVLYLFFTRTCLRLRFLHIINHFGFMQISKFFYLSMIPSCVLRPWCCPSLSLFGHIGM